MFNGIPGTYSMQAWDVYKDGQFYTIEYQILYKLILERKAACHFGTLSFFCPLLHSLQFNQAQSRGMHLWVGAFS